ncbi:MAG: OmpA family protein, partial [Treponema sp.]|nr:OmpA family protein [Treponema sp.]
KDSRNTSETFWKTSGKIMPADETQADTYRAAVVWDGRGNNGEIVMSAEDYPYKLTVTDELGMTSVYEGIIPVDVLVLFDGGRLKMQVPSIVFRGDAADFLLAGERDASGKVLERSSLTPEQKANNIRVLNRVAQILGKFSNYKVTVVGHANPMNQFNGREEDNPEENRDGPWGRGLKALSLERAQFVVRWLSGEGKISSARLRAEGKGGLETIADKNDLKNRWKNRRVEFILEK